jgi:hypothetical protein
MYVDRPIAIHVAARSLHELVVHWNRLSYSASGSSPNSSESNVPPSHSQHASHNPHSAHMSEAGTASSHSGQNIKLPSYVAS